MRLGHPSTEQISGELITCAFLNHTSFSASVLLRFCLSLTRQTSPLNTSPSSHHQHTNLHPHHSSLPFPFFVARNTLTLCSRRLALTYSIRDKQIFRCVNALDQNSTSSLSRSSLSTLVAAANAGYPADHQVTFVTSWQRVLDKTAVLQKDHRLYRLKAQSCDPFLRRVSTVLSPSITISCRSSAHSSTCLQL